MPRFFAAFGSYGLPIGEGDPVRAAESIRQRPALVQEVIVDALDEWESEPRNSWRPTFRAQWVRAVLQAVKPDDTWGSKVRAARQEPDAERSRTALEELADTADIRQLPARALTSLARLLSLPKAVELLRRAQRQHPADFWVNHDLGGALQNLTPPQRTEAVRFLTVAAALRPESPGIQLNLGNALGNNGQLDEAVLTLRRAIELDAQFALGHAALGHWLAARGELEEASASYQKAIDLDPTISPRTYHDLGQLLLTRGLFEEAVAVWRRGVELDPVCLEIHIKLGSALLSRNRWDEAIVNLHKASVVHPNNAEVCNNLGIALRKMGRVEEGIVCHRRAIELNANLASAHINLGQALQQQGRFGASLEAFRRGHELGSKEAGWRLPSGEWVRGAERLAALEARLPAFLKGEFQPTNLAERQGLAVVCQAKKYHAAAARLYADMFTAAPKLADDLKAAHRYHAACNAVRAGTGQGEDAVTLDRECVRLRKQALDWLRADLGLWTERLQNGEPTESAAVLQQLQHWQQDDALSAIRDGTALAKLAVEERANFSRLWADVAALVKKAEETR